MARVGPQRHKENKKKNLRSVLVVGFSYWDIIYLLLFALFVINLIFLIFSLFFEPQFKSP